MGLHISGLVGAQTRLRKVRDKREQNWNETDRQKQDTFPCTGKHGSLREAVGMNARNKSKFRDGPVR